MRGGLFSRRGFVVGSRLRLSASIPTFGRRRGVFGPPHSAELHRLPSPEPPGGSRDIPGPESATVRLDEFRIRGNRADASGPVGVWPDPITRCRDAGPRSTTVAGYAAAPPVQPLHSHWIPPASHLLGFSGQPLLPTQRNHQHIHPW